jgi:hypothetical protein
VTTVTTNTRTARPVYTVRLDPATGAVCEGFGRLSGTASTADEAAAIAKGADKCIDAIAALDLEAL